MVAVETSGPRRPAPGTRHLHPSRSTGHDAAGSCGRTRARLVAFPGPVRIGPPEPPGRQRHQRHDRASSIVAAAPADACDRAVVRLEGPGRISASGNQSVSVLPRTGVSRNVRHTLRTARSARVGKNQRPVRVASPAASVGTKRRWATQATARSDRGTPCASSNHRDPSERKDERFAGCSSRFRPRSSPWEPWSVADRSASGVDREPVMTSSAAAAFSGS
jgi:hypothetical protein